MHNKRVAFRNSESEQTNILTKKFITKTTDISNFVGKIYNLQSTIVAFGKYFSLLVLNSLYHFAIEMAI